MSVKKLEGGRYKVDIRPRGAAGRRIQRVFDKKAEAVAYEKHIIANAHDKEWLAKPVDPRRLADLIDPWWKLSGRNQEYGHKRKVALMRLAEVLANPFIAKINKNLLMNHSSERLHSGIKASTINRDLNLLSGMFTVLIEAGEFIGANPMRDFCELKQKPVEMTYLTTSEVGRLLDSFGSGTDAQRLTILCLSTGARWGEATMLRADHFMHNRVTFIETKNGKKRTVPVSKEVQSAVRTTDTGRLFDVSYMDYRKVLKSVKPDLPKGQAVHVLRHTFAAHFIMNGGNILTLQKILGHSNIQQTMVYAHLAPDYLHDATELNPLRGGIHIPSTSVDFRGVPRCP